MRSCLKSEMFLPNSVDMMKNLFRMVWWSSNFGHPWWMCLSWRNIFWWRWYGLQWCSTIWFWTFNHHWDNYCCDCNRMLLRVLLFWQKSFRMFEKIIPIPLVKYIERLIVNFVSTLSDLQLLMNKRYYVYLFIIFKTCNSSLDEFR